MNGFITTANPPTAAQEPVVQNDGWFPDMDPKAVRAACRLDGTVTAERLRPALLDAMLTVNREVQDWASEQRTRWGYATLADVPAPQVGGESAKLQQYRRAVHACVQADLAEAYRNLSTIPSGMSKGDRVLGDLALEVDEHRRRQRWAISDLLGTARCTVDLL